MLADIDFIPWQATAPLPLLGLMTGLPSLVIPWVLRAKSARVGWRIGLATGAMNLLLAIWLLYAFDPHSAQVQLAEQWDGFGLSYRAGVDGANILFIPMTALLGWLALLYAQTRNPTAPKWVVSSLLAYQTVLIGAFGALNAMQFWWFCVLELLPVSVLTLQVGVGKQRRAALGTLLQYWGGALLLVFAGFVMLAYNVASNTQVFSFDWLILQKNTRPIADEGLIFMLLFYGFAVRMPLFPFHGWFPRLAEHGTLASVGVFLVGLKLGVYALIRFVLPLVPGAAEQYSGFAVGLGLLAMYYGALLALLQINLRRLLAFAVVSHTGMLVVGAFCLNDDGLEGTLLLMADYGLASAGLLFCLGLLYYHTHSTQLPRLGGLFDGHTALALLFLVAALSTMAMPGTPGFDAAHQLLDGTIAQHGWGVAIAAATGNVLAAAFLLWAFQQVFFADRKRPWRASVSPYVANERAIAISVCALLIGMSFYITPWITYIDSAVDTVREHYQSADDNTTTGRHHD